MITRDEFEAEAFERTRGLLVDVYGDEEPWRPKTHVAILEAAVNVAWARTRVVHPVVRYGMHNTRTLPKKFFFTPVTAHVLSRARKYLELPAKMRQTHGIHIVQALADKVKAGHESRQNSKRDQVPMPPAEPFLVLNLGSGKNKFADVARWFAEPTTNPEARIDMKVVAVDNNPAWRADIVQDLKAWRTWYKTELDRLLRGPWKKRIDYIHFSPECGDFSIMKQTGVSGEQEIEEAVWLVIMGCAFMLELDPRVFTLENGYRGIDALRRQAIMEPLMPFFRKATLCKFYRYPYHKLGSWWTSVPEKVWSDRMPPLCAGRDLCPFKVWTNHHKREMQGGEGAEAAAFPAELCEKLVGMAMVTCRYYKV